MHLYHGSNSCFRKFNLRKAKSNYTEGKGIYMVDISNRKVVASYGKYMYTISVADNRVLNLRNKQVIYRLFLCSVGNVRTPSFLKISNQFIEGVLTGQIVIRKGYIEICNLFDAYEDTYIYIKDVNVFFNNIKLRYLTYLDKYDIIRYNDRSLGVVYQSIKPDKLPIINRVKQ